MTKQYLTTKFKQNKYTEEFFFMKQAAIQEFIYIYDNVRPFHSNPPLFLNNWNVQYCLKLLFLNDFLIY